MERVEVLRGPQSTAFGRANFAGAVNYVTKDPGTEFNASLHLASSDLGRNINPNHGFQEAGAGSASGWWNSPGAWATWTSAAAVRAYCDPDLGKYTHLGSIERS